MSRPFAALAAAAVTTALAACSSASSPAASLPPAPATTAAPATALTPLTLGHFPATTDGRLARSICQAWAGLRQQYTNHLDDMTPVQLEQWLSGPDWAPARDAATELGNDLSYTHIEAAYGTATASVTASTASARVLDRACENAE